MFTNKPLMRGAAHRRTRRRVAGFAGALALVALTTTALRAARPNFGGALDEYLLSGIIAFLLPVVLISSIWNKRAGLLAVAVSCLSAWCFLRPGPVGFAARPPHDIVAIAAFALVGLSLVLLLNRMRSAQETLSEQPAAGPAPAPG